MVRRVAVAWVLGVLIAAVVVLFVWLKRYNAFGSLPTFPIAYVTVGLSYILFRILHLMIDVGQGELRRPSPLDFWNYVLFFPSFVSGPIQRYDDFSRQIASAADATPLDVDRTVNRVLLGYIFIVVIAPWLLDVTGIEQASLYVDFDTKTLGLYGIIHFAGAAALFLFYLYFNFAGYMHIVIGFSGLAGIELPENFNAPFRTANFMDFWTRWHITLADWFRYYLFNPLAKFLIARWGNPTTLPYLGAVAFFCTFLVMGIWHGPTRIFVVYGLFLGAGVTATKIWQIEMTKRLGKGGYRRLASNVLYQSICRAAALSYFALSLTCVWIDGGHRNDFLSRGGLLAAAGAVAALTLLGAVIDLAVRLIAGGWKASAPSIGRERSAEAGLPATGCGFALAAWTAAKICAVGAVLVMFGSAAPEFVYKAF